MFEKSCDVEGSLLDSHISVDGHCLAPMTGRYGLIQVSHVMFQIISKIVSRG